MMSFDAAEHPTVKRFFALCEETFAGWEVAESKPVREPSTAIKVPLRSFGSVEMRIRESALDAYSDLMLTTHVATAADGFRSLDVVWVARPVGVMRCDDDGWITLWIEGSGVEVPSYSAAGILFSAVAIATGKGESK